MGTVRGAFSSGRVSASTAKCFISLRKHAACGGKVPSASTKGRFVTAEVRSARHELSLRLRKVPSTLPKRTLRRGKWLRPPDEVHLPTTQGASGSSKAPLPRRKSAAVSGEGFATSAPDTLATGKDDSLLCRPRVLARGVGSFRGWLLRPNARRVNADGRIHRATPVQRNPLHAPERRSRPVGLMRPVRRHVGTHGHRYPRGSFNAAVALQRRRCSSARSCRGATPELQCGRRSSATEMWCDWQRGYPRRSSLRRIASGWLQCGRRSSATEMARRDSGAAREDGGASMRPSLFSDGDRRSRRAGCRGAAALQCGRRSSATEIRARACERASPRCRFNAADALQRRR